MKVIGINGSAREDGNTAILIKIIFDEFSKEDIKTELIQLANKEIKSCKGCFKCRGKKKCIFEDDDFNECFKAMTESEGIVLGSPVYSADVTSKMKAFLERAGVVIAVNPGMIKYKVCASVAAVRRGGGITAVDTMNHFFLNKEVILAGSTYWNMVYGKDIGDVLDDKEGINNMINLGKNMSWILKKTCTES